MLQSPPDQFWHHVTDLSIKTQLLFTAAPPRLAALTFSTQPHNFTASTFPLSSFTFQHSAFNFQPSTFSVQLPQLPKPFHNCYDFHKRHSPCSTYLSTFTTSKLDNLQLLLPHPLKFISIKLHYRGGGLEGGGAGTLQKAKGISTGGKQKLPRITKNYQELLRITKNHQELPRIDHDFTKDLPRIYHKS